MKRALIYSIQEQLSEGVFGQVMSWILEILPFLEEEGYLPENVSWDIHTRWYRKVIPGILLPKTTSENDGPCNYLNLVHIKSQHSYKYGFTDESFQKANKFLNRWFDIPGFIFEQLPEFPKNHRTLGLHYRGTDKNLDLTQSNPLTIDEFVLLAKDYMASTDFDSIFVCSDEDVFSNQIRSFFPRTQVFEIEQCRSKDSTPLFKESANCTDNFRRELMLNTLRDVLALSQCKAVLKCSSSLSAWAKIFNPECEVYQVSAMKLPWFPCGAIPPYSPSTNIAKNILLRSMHGNYMTRILREIQ